MTRSIYLDHDAANPPDPRVLEVHRRALAEGWANPSSPHGPGRRARALIEEAREQVAALVGVAPGQVTFTASGTEALNLALWTVAARPGARVVASAVEHPAVLEPLAALTRADRVEAALAPVDAVGRVDVARLADLAPGAALVAVMAAQNETGVLQPLDEVGRACDAAGAPLLVDACQALGRVERDWAAAPWDLLVLSAQKLRAPRGAAALVHRRRAGPPRPLLTGGPQELGRRAGTEDVAAIAALGAACDLARTGALLDPGALLALRDRVEALLLEAIPGLEVVAREAARLPQTTALLVPGGDSEALLAGLDLAGVAASAGAACSSGSLVRSHVLEAMGVPADRARGRLRLSFGPETTWDELATAAEALARLARQPATRTRPCRR